MVYLVLVSIIWGFSFVIIKGSLVDLDSNFVSLVRMALSFLVFLPCMRPSGIGLRDGLRFMAIGAIQFGLMYVAYVASFARMPAHLIALFTTTTPLFVALIGDAWEGRVRKSLLPAALLAVAGGAVMKFPDQQLETSVYGILLLQLSNAAFAFGQIAYRRRMRLRKDLRDRDVIGPMYLGAVLLTGAFAAATTDFSGLRVRPEQWLALGYLGVIASGLCFYLWNLGARKVREGILAVMNNLKIPVGVVASLLVLREGVDGLRLAAGGVLFAAALWAARAGRGAPEA